MLKHRLLPAIQKYRKSFYTSCGEESFATPECYGADNWSLRRYEGRGPWFLLYIMLWCTGCLLSRVQAAGSVGCVCVRDTTEIIMYWDQINKIRHLPIHLFPQMIWLKHDKLRCAKIMWHVDLSPSIRLHQITNQANLRLPDNVGSLGSCDAVGFSSTDQTLHCSSITHFAMPARVNKCSRWRWKQFPRLALRTRPLVGWMALYFVQVPRDLWLQLRSEMMIF